MKILMFVIGTLSNCNCPCTDLPWYPGIERDEKNLGQFL